MICRVPGLVELGQGAAAAMRSRVEVTREPERLRAAWRDARAVLVGADSAAWVAGLGLPARPGVHVVGRSAQEVMDWSVPLEASVLVLPEQSGYVSTILEGPSDAGGGMLLRVIGASGGLGVSTLCAGLAQVAAEEGTAALVELARAGGGIDVMLGVEQQPGWRWDDLGSAAGTLGDLVARLPGHDRVPVVSLGRQGTEPAAEAASSVLRALLRTQDVVVVDAGRGDDAAGVHWTRARTLLVVGADVRGVLAARAMAQAQGRGDVEIVVRRGPGRSLTRDEVADALGLPVVGEVGHHRSLPLALAQGTPPATGDRRFARTCRRLLQEVGS